MKQPRHESAGSVSDRARETGPAITSVAALVVRWQETACQETLARLIEVVVPEVERAAATTLRRSGVHDPAAIDDAVALVLDHLRRLPGGGADEPRVAKFCPRRPGVASRAIRDPGRDYLRRVARARAIDVVRRRRRDDASFSELGSRDGVPFEQTIAGDAGDGPPPLSDRVREAARRLEPRQRVLVEMLLDGKSQTTIAHVLGTSEGTVSRLRVRAIESLRRILTP